MSYAFEYTGPDKRPQWVRVVAIPGAEDQRIVLNFDNWQEREGLTTDEVYVHLENLVQYMKDISQTISPIGLGDVPTDGWHFSGKWSEVEWAKDESYKWWESVYYKDEEAEEEIA